MTRSLWIGIGGGLGALARYALLGLWPGQAIPYNIALINVGGSLLIAVVMTLAIEYGWPGERGRLFWTTGVLGGFTTFSTFMLGIHTLLAGHAILSAYTYAVGSLVAGLAACWFGTWWSRRLIACLTGRSERNRDDNDASRAVSSPAPE